MFPVNTLHVTAVGVRCRFAPRRRFAASGLPIVLFWWVLVLASLSARKLKFLLLQAAGMGQSSQQAGRGAVVRL